jgi:hypothetical protein
VDDEFERQDAERKACGQRPLAEYNIAGQSSAPPSRQDRLSDFLDALVYRAAVGHADWYTGGGSKPGDGIDEMVGEGRHIEVATGRGTVKVAVANRLDDMMQATGRRSRTATPNGCFTSDARSRRYPDSSVLRDVTSCAAPEHLRRQPR